MPRIALLLILSVAIPCLAEEPLGREYLPVSHRAQADSESFTLTSPVPAARPESITSAPVAPEGGMSSSSQISNHLSEPPLLSAKNINPVVQPLVAVSNPTFPHKPSARQRRAWWVLTVAQHGAATFDAWSTRKSLASGNGYERNPLMKPFADSASIYPIVHVLPLGLDYASIRMIRSRHGFFRKTWWVPQTIATAGFIWVGTRNLRVSNVK
jgi:hypothetical protein